MKTKTFLFTILTLSIFCTNFFAACPSTFGAAAYLAETAPCITQAAEMQPATQQAAGFPCPAEQATDAKHAARTQHAAVQHADAKLAAETNYIVKNSTETHHAAQHAAAQASSQATVYARVEASTGAFGADFFVDGMSESLFQIPNHYYVLASGVDGEFFQVTYKNALSGLVRRSDLTLVEGTPENEFPAITFHAKSAGNLFNSADKTSKGVAVQESSVLEYFGQKNGESLQTDINGNPVTTWYYVRTASNEFGYIHTTDVSQIPNPARPADDPDLLLPAADQNLFATNTPTTFSGLSLGTQIMLIVAISIPSILILYFLIKPTKIAQSARAKVKTAKKPKKRVSHGDYFEFDEGEL